jgi:hypothetical protein
MTTPIVLTPDQIRQFAERGFLHIPAVLCDEEVSVIEETYGRFMRKEISGMGHDFCDMSGPYDREFKDFALINAMLPRVYAPELIGNVLETRSAQIAAQLIGEDIQIDYDQFLAKKPNCPTAEFSWHQDQGYWPAGTPDTRTVTCSLAIDDSLKVNGCIRFIPGSGVGQTLRTHRSAKSSREEGHTLVAEVGDEEEVEFVEVKRGGITLHDEWVMHGSAGNLSSEWRRTYVIAYRSHATVAYERALGFTHSHNDKVNWTTTLGAYEDKGGES